MSGVQDDPMMVDDESGEQMSGSNGAAPLSGYHCLLKNGRSLSWLLEQGRDKLG